jgi:hypothetical protein
MKNNRWVWWTLTILLTLVVLVGVGAAGFRMGSMQNFRGNGEVVQFGPMHNFRDNLNNNNFQPPMQRMPGFNHERGFARGGGGRGGFFFPSLFGLVHLALFGLVLWAGYQLYRKSGWKFVKVNAQETAPIEEKKE